MATRFSQIFTLKDIFNNKKLAGKIPLINYREREREDGKTMVRTSPKSVPRLVYDTSVKAARPYYKPLNPSKSGDTIIIDGMLVGDHDAAVNAVYAALVAQKQIMKWTVNNADMIRDALKEGEKNARLYGISSKLYLRAQSMQEIEGMSKRQIQALMTDIMENIVYGDDFPKTKKKWGVENFDAIPQRGRLLDYNQLRQMWKNKVGD